MSQDRVLSKCMDLIDSAKVMTIATGSENGAWSAPVYYHFFNKAFYFFSNPSSRHIIEALDTRTGTAVSIFEDSEQFEDLKGARMG